MKWKFTSINYIAWRVAIIAALLVIVVRSFAQSLGILNDRV